ncbi:MAG: protein phosphatase 2C domain-containing protein [Planctomycetaceae bacterium]
MQEAKNTQRALVKIGYDGRVHKFFKADRAQERFENELMVLQYLERRGCEFVPRVLGFDREHLELVTSNCGARVDRMNDERVKQLFDELESYGVRHEDPFLRNITYRASDGRFCLIDFEFATILEPDAVTAEAPEFEAAAHAADAFKADSTTLKIKWSAATDIGKYRPNNEDQFVTMAFNTEEFNYLAREGEVHIGDFDFVFAVSDGMGGEKSGEFASRFAIDNITRLLSRRFSLSTAQTRAGIHNCLEDLIHGIHRQLTQLGESYDGAKNMGATLSMVWYVQGWFYFGHIGDSRIYYLPKGGGMTQVTEDHTYVGWLRRKGEINEREARNHPRKNVLAQSLGSGNQFIKPQIGELNCERGDRILICSDGVIDGLWDRGIEELLREPPESLISLNPAQRLVRAAVDESGRDNTTAVVLEIV